VTFADAVAAGGSSFGAVLFLCLSLVCLFLISAGALAVVLIQRSRRKPPGGVA
jgi:hypothetical protein